MAESLCRFFQGWLESELRSFLWLIVVPIFPGGRFIGRDSFTVSAERLVDIDILLVVTE